MRNPVSLHDFVSFWCVCGAALAMYAGVNLLVQDQFGIGIPEVCSERVTGLKRTVDVIVDWANEQ